MRKVPCPVWDVDFTVYTCPQRWCLAMPVRKDEDNRKVCAHFLCTLMRRFLFSLDLLLGIGVSQASELPNDAIYVWTSPTTYDCYLISGTPTITYDDNFLVIEVNGIEAKRINLSNVDDVEVTYGIKYPLVTLNSKGYATLSFKADMQLSSNCMKAYTAKVEGNKIICTEIADGIIPAGNGVILYGVPSTSAQLLASTTTTTLLNNDLRATTKADGSLTDVPTSGYNFVLNGDKFLQYTGTSFVADKAFFNLSYNPVSTNGAKFDILFDEDNVTTGIEEIVSKTNSVYYDLQGRKVERPTTGVYIVNGKKRVIK